MAIIHDGNSVPISSGNPLPTQLSGSDVQIPVDIQSRYATTVQSHVATMVPPVGSSVPTTFIDCQGFDKVAVTLLNDAATSTTGYIQWSNDGVGRHGDETIIPVATAQRRSAITDVKARYAKFYVDNNDAGAVHTMSAWVYLKA